MSRGDGTRTDTSGTAPIRVLTNIDANHGSVVFNVALQQILSRHLPRHSARFLNIVPAKWRAYEWLRFAKVFRRIPLYNYRRHRTLQSFSAEHLTIERFPRGLGYDRAMEHLGSIESAAVVTAKVVWNMDHGTFTPSFPNIFWPSAQVRSPRIAYAVSGHLTDLALIGQHRDRIREIVDGFALVGVRDAMTEAMLAQCGVDVSTGSVRRICDPAFLFDPRPLDLDALCARLGIARDRPVAGLLLFGKKDISRAIVDHFHESGHQVVNFNMFNPHADVNVGHVVDPDEWAALFHALDFCVTDRFHCSIFNIRARVPFIAIEPFRAATPLNSKIHNLLADFGLADDCYVNQYEDGFATGSLIERMTDVGDRWVNEIAPPLTTRVEGAITRHVSFASEIAALVGP